MKSKILLWLVFWGICFVWSGCGTGDTPVVNLPKQTKDSISNIKFFLEASESMEGYMRGGAVFSKVIPNLLVEMENNIPATHKQVSIYYIKDTLESYTNDIRSFIHDISMI